ncbi:Hypoxanthine-guanine phosphoribosyltransferase [Diplonema papillatum]|uniref:Hypoxanthine phosphoribosyltransferase n=1 Tax=Diplonema papillatum TaxID=91374 RepID=A0A0B6VM36_9EUGL|nr:Hypoxanthine-guanine phosphoribosyltransferase [Diplonema papillatum]BAQ25453.1 hypoxanthine-guanine phosphoribosyltransferase [Diplonema papillatum]|eukprot:gene713-1088_t
MTWEDIMKEEIVSKERIESRINELADQIVEDYSKVMDKGEEIMLVCILKGSYIFTADLSRAISARGVSTVIDFMCVSSYGSGTESSGEVRVLLDLRKPMRGKHVLVVEDICESARTLAFLQHTFRSRSPKSLKTVTLLDKPYKRISHDVSLDYVGFTIPDHFVVGYGLDYDEKFRSLPNVIVLRPSVYSRL